MKAPRNRRPAVAGTTLLLALAFALPAAPQVTKVDQLHFPPLPAFEIPKPTRVVLPNGMVVMLLEDHELPLVDATALIRTGSRLEPADKVGLAELTGRVLRTGGTTSMSGDQIDDFLEDKAASIETSIGTESGTASLSALKGDFPEVLKVFADVLRHPIFDPDKIEVAKTGMVAGIARQNDNPLQVMFREFNQLVYGKTSPYARQETYETVGHITRDDLVAWHAEYYHPNRIVLGLSGDFDTREALRQVKEVFGDWKRGPKPAPTEADVAYAKDVTPGFFWARKDDMTQADIAMGYLGIRKDNPDFYAVEVMNEVMSGGFASRLFSNVRSKKGLAYSVRGSVDSDWDHDGTTLLWMTTKTETTGEGIDALLEEARNMVEQPPTDQEVTKAKSGILNSFVFNFDSPRKVLSQQLTFEYYGYPLDRLARYRSGIEAVTTDHVRAAAKKYLHPDRFAILVVGPKASGDQLARFGEVQDLDISIPEPAAPKMEVSKEGSQRAKALLAKALEAAGGAQRVRGIASVKTASTVVRETPQGQVEIKAETLYVYPDRFRQDMTLPFGKMAMAVAGDSGFVVTPRGVQDLPASQREAIVSSYRRNPLWLLKASGRPDFVSTAAGKDEVEGTPVEQVQVKVAGEVTTLAIDPASGHILQVRYRGTGGGGQPGDVTQTYGDFRNVDGVEIPFAVSGTFNGKPALSSKVESVTIDGDIDPGLFTKPEAKPPAP